MGRSLFGVALLGMLFGCATKVPLSSSADIPAARGEVKLDRTDQGNTKVEVTVKHLAEPAQVQQGATTYVVWAAPRDAFATPQSLGALRVGDDLEGKLETTTPLRAFDLFITAEPSASVPQPSGNRLMWSQIDLARR